MTLNLGSGTPQLNLGNVGGGTNQPAPTLNLGGGN